MNCLPYISPSNVRSTGRLGDWYANIHHFSRLQLVLAVSERTLLPVVLRAKDVASLPEFLPPAVGEVLAAIGVPTREIDLELAEMNQVLFAKTASRQVLGSMNDFAYQLEGYLQDSGSLLELALKVGEAPMGPLGMQDPISATQAAFTMPSPRLI